MVPIDAYLSETWRPDREFVDGEVLERNVGRIEHSSAQMAVAGYLFGLRQELGLSVLPEVRVQVKPTRFRIPDVCVVKGIVGEGGFLDRPPFICIEILSKDDTMSSMQERIADFLDFGVPHLWVIDPRLNCCYVYTRDGMRTLAAGDLVTVDPEIRLPLAAIFN